jgi:CRP/FNR family transcriptional regulator, cyclic AMP receptor protein
MPKHEPITPAVVRDVALFEKLDEAQVQQVCALLKERRYRKGDIIFHRDDEGNCLFIISSGRVRIYLASQDGREATVRIYGPHSTFGEFAVLDGAPRSATAAALDDVTALVLYRDDFLGLLRRNFDLVLQVFAMLTERARYTTDYTEQLAFLSGPGRVAAALLQLAGVESAGYGPARLELTQQELAAFTNTTREWANHTLREFAEQGLIALERGAVIVLDREGLRRRVG